MKFLSYIWMMKCKWFQITCIQYVTSKWLWEGGNNEKKVEALATIKQKPVTHGVNECADTKHLLQKYS